MAPTIRSWCWLYPEADNTTAGRVRSASCSRKGNGTKTTAPALYAIMLLPIVIDGVLGIVPILFQTLHAQLRPVFLFRPNHDFHFSSLRQIQRLVQLDLLI